MYGLLMVFLLFIANLIILGIYLRISCINVFLLVLIAQVRSYSMDHQERLSQKKQ
jgi:hypothetical protein